MKALVSLNELSSYGYRVAQVETDNNVFPIAEKLFWIDCPDEATPNEWYYNPANSKVELIPPPEPAPNQPISQGAQDL